MIEESDLIYNRTLKKKHFSIKENTPMFEKHHSEKTKLKISKSRTGKYFGKNNPNFGKKHTEESKLKISNGHKGKIGAGSGGKIILCKVIGPKKS